MEDKQAWPPVTASAVNENMVTIGELQGEIQSLRAERQTLRQHVKGLQRSLEESKGVAKHWEEVAKAFETEAEDAKAQAQDLAKQSLRIEGERNALAEMVDRLLDRLGARGADRGTGTPVLRTSEGV